MSKRTSLDDVMKNLQTQAQAGWSPLEDAGNLIAGKAAEPRDTSLSRTSPPEQRAGRPRRTSVIRSFSVLQLLFAALSLTLASCDPGPASDDEGASTTASGSDSGPGSDSGYAATGETSPGSAEATPLADTGEPRSDEITEVEGVGRGEWEDFDLVADPDPAALGKECKATCTVAAYGAICPSTISGYGKTTFLGGCTKACNKARDDAASKLPVGCIINGCNLTGC